MAGRGAGELDSGSVTVEAALGIIAIVAVVAVVFSGLSVALAQGSTCNDARIVARSVSVGESPPPTESVVSWESDGTWVRVQARRSVPAGVVLGQGSVECELQTQDERSM